MAKAKDMARLRVLVLVSTLLIVGIAGYFVIQIARGYSFDTDKLKFSANGILVAKSEPDGASVIIDGDLRGATNTNIKLPPKTYSVEVKKNGYISWKKDLTLKKEEVTQITAQLFKIAPSFSPITYDGAENPVVSEDFSKIAYTNEEGLWIMNVSSLPIGFPNEPKKILEGIITGATYKFSPDSRELMVDVKNATYLLNTNELTSQADLINIVNQKEVILAEWAEDKQKKDDSNLRLIPIELANILIKNTKNFSFAPDETMVMYEASTAATLKDNLIPKLPGSSNQKESRDIKVGRTYIYDIKEDKNFEVLDNGRSLYWMPTSRHLLLPDEGKIVIMDYDGTNRQTVFSGDYISPHAYPFVNASKLLILTNLGSDSSTPNLYSLSIK